MNKIPNSRREQLFRLASHLKIGFLLVSFPEPLFRYINICVHRDIHNIKVIMSMFKNIYKFMNYI